MDWHVRVLRRLLGLAAIGSAGGVDSDLDIDDQPTRRVTNAAVTSDRPRWPRIHWDAVGVIALGGIAGGLARYGIGRAWPAAPGAFPWATFAINTTGAFVLAVVLVVALERLPGSTLLRPALGTGFCGAYTTFSSVAVDTDRLTAHGHAGLAAVYVLGSLFAGLAATVGGIVAARSLAASSGVPR